MDLILSNNIDSYILIQVLLKRKQEVRNRCRVIHKDNCNHTTPILLDGRGRSCSDIIEILSIIFAPPKPAYDEYSYEDTVSSYAKKKFPPKSMRKKEVADEMIDDENSDEDVSKDELIKQRINETARRRGMTAPSAASLVNEKPAYSNPEREYYGMGGKSKDDLEYEYQDMVKDIMEGGGED